MELNRRALLTTLAGVLAGGKIFKAQELPSVLLDPRQARLEAGPVGEHRVYLEGSTEGLKSLVVGSLFLKPGQQPHPPHSHAEEEVIAVVEGTGEITLNGTASNVGPGTVMYAAPHCLHGVRNTSTHLLMLYYFKWLSKSLNPSA